MRTNLMMSTPWPLTGISYYAHLMSLCHVKLVRAQQSGRPGSASGLRAKLARRGDSERFRPRSRSERALITAG